MDELIIQGRRLSSRLFTGSGKYGDDSLIPQIIAAAECEVVTVALRRVDLDKPQENLLQYFPKDKILLPNTSGARTADEAVRIAHLARAMGCGDWIKIEVINDQKYLLPDNLETLKAVEILAAEGFVVLPYMNPDLSMARRMVQAGAAAIMPFGAPIGTNKGLATLELLKILVAEIEKPVIVDAGIGAPSHAAAAMEIGVSAILLNTAIALSQNPVKMADAFKLAIRAGRTAYLAGLAPRSDSARASSPLTGFLN
ncbi:MAG: thiazole synthase [Elusimicrobia bacterium RIFOXYB2_FULL_49_7]|nr:MAG: thiazole synthase [Elusimicrobia bacterium RIFOXYB2_FULL_49_7]